MEYGLKWVKWMDISNRKLTRNYSSNASKQNIIIIEHHVSPFYPSCTHQLTSPSSIYALIWERHYFQFIIIPSKAFVFLFRTYFSFIGKGTGGTSSILSLNTDLTIYGGHMLPVTYKVGFVIFLSRSIARKSLIERVIKFVIFLDSC